MLKIIRCLLIQKKFISRCSKGNQYEMILYNEKPQTTFVVGLDKDMKKDLNPHEVNIIRNKHSITICSSKENHFILHTNSRINTPVIQDRIDNEAPVIKLKDIVKWLAKSPDSDSRDPVQPGTRIGRLDAANEAGFFHRTDRSRLKEIKKKLKDKVETEPTEPKKSA